MKETVPSPPSSFPIPYLGKSGSIAMQIASRTKGRKTVTIPNLSRYLMMRFKTSDQAMPT